MDSTTGGPMVRLGTKWPSMTSRCRREAPPRSTRAISSASRAKSADRIEGTISIICGLLRFYHSSKETVSRLLSGKPHLDFGGSPGQGENLFVFLGFQGTGRVNQNAAGSQRRAGIAQQGRLALLEIRQVLGAQLPLDFGIAPEGAGAGTRGVYQDAVEGP